MPTTRVYQYGAVPTSPYPEEAVEELFRANRLWNALVEIHNGNADRWNQQRCKADAEYADVWARLTKIEDEIVKAFARKRDARRRAGDRDADHPLIKAANNDIDALKQRRRDLWKAGKPAKARADKRLNKKTLNRAFTDAVNAAGRVGNTGGLDAVTANEVLRNFKEARGRVFQNPGSHLRFHRFDGTGYRFYRFRDRAIGTTRDGVTLSYLFSRGPEDDRAFLLREGVPRRGAPRWRLRAKVAGGRTKESRVYAEFDIVVHRPIPDAAQINNAKLMRRRVGDRFRYTVNFSVRVADPDPVCSTTGSIGVDIGFRGFPDGTMRAATIAVKTADGMATQHMTLPKPYSDRMKHIETLQSELGKTADKLGQRITPFLKAGSVLPKEHPKYALVHRVATAPSTVTMSFEQAYKMAAWFRKEPGVLPPDVQKALMEWWNAYRRSYREMHNLKAKTLAWRREQYRIIATRLVGYRVPIGIEAIDLNVFAETKDVENPLSNRARSQRFLVAPSEFIGAIRNAAGREGVEVLEIPAPNTSRKCHGCDTVNTELKSELEWVCPSCGMTHDRDENAAKNIANATAKTAQKKTTRVTKQTSAE